MEKIYVITRNFHNPFELYPHVIGAITDRNKFMDFVKEYCSKNNMDEPHADETGNILSTRKESEGIYESAFYITEINLIRE